MYRYIREPINGLTHLLGAILAIIGTVFLIIKGSQTLNSTVEVSSLIIFGVSMFLLYGASATYHMVIASDNVIAWLRKLDHSMIYLLIAGTYWYVNTKLYNFYKVFSCQLRSFICKF